MTAITTDAPAAQADPPPGPERAATHDTRAEQTVLGAMMLTQDAIGDATDLLGPGDFYQPAHATIYQAICHQYTAGEPTDPAAITARLLAAGELGRTGGAAYLDTLIAVVPVPAPPIGWYARRIADTAGRRRLAAAAITIGQAAADPGLSLTDAQDRAGAALQHALADEQTEGPIQAGTLVTDAFNRIEAAAAGTGNRGLTTGHIDLDQLTGGLKPGQLWVIAGRPGMGKSVAALDAARANAIGHKTPALISTLEMSRAEVIDRILAAETGTRHHAIQAGHVDDTAWTRLALAAAELQDAPLFIDDTNVNLMQLRARARRMQQRTGLGLLVVDYLQLMPAASAGGRDRSREREVAELSRGLKLLAKELAIPVIAVSQLNRGNESRSDKRPILGDLRESGAIEADADMVILLHRDDYYDKESPRAGEADFIVAKNRGGPTDTITVAAQLHLMRFRDLAMPTHLN